MEPWEISKAQENWRKYPLLCSEQFFGSRLWAKQEEVMLAVRDYAKVAVKSGNTVGKSRIAAEISLTFLLSYYPSKVIITAPTFTQIEEILWKEIAGLYNKTKIPIGGELLKTELKLNEQWFALGVSTNEVNRFQGFHSPYLLVIVDEALGVSKEIWEAIEGLHPFRVLAIGNPLLSSGDFFQCFSSALWHKITITCQECVDWQNKFGKIPGLVTQAWINERKKEWGENHPLYQSRVEATFPEIGTNSVIQPLYVKDAVDRELRFNPTGRITVCDVGAEGDDSTVIYNMEGYKIVSQDISNEKDTMKTAGKIIIHKNQFRSDLIVIDKCGLGKGVYDRVREVLGAPQNHIVYGLDSAETPKTENKEVQFLNVRAEMWWYVGELFRDCLTSIPIDEELKQDLKTPTYEVIDSSGKIKIEAKKDIKARLGRSPDKGDTYVMGCYAQQFVEKRRNFKQVHHPVGRV